MYTDDEIRPPLARRASAALEKAEKFYLRVLRAGILIIATLLLLYAAWLAVSSIYKLSRSTDSVVEEQASVSADEITNAEAPAIEKTVAANEPSQNPEHRRFYDAFAKRYFTIYQAKFERYRQTDDKKLTLSEFDDTYLNTPQRLQAIASGELSFEDDRDDLESLHKVMAEAADKPLTQERLVKYQKARKVPVQQKVERTRTTYRRGWDSYSTACYNWYESPIGCSVMRPVQTNYTETVTKMEYPKGTQTHAQIFRAFQDRYFELLQERREENAAKAERDRQNILAGFIEGELSLVTALQVLGAFMVLMFFFLLIAIERHQRRLSREMAAD